MKRSLQLILVIVFTNITYSFSQQRITPPVIVCPANTNYHDFHIQPPAKFLAAHKNAKTASGNVTAQFVVTYHGFENFPEAKNAFQFAVDIWATLLKSDVPIYIDASYTELASGVLGAAGTTRLYKGFDGAPNDSTFYNVALAEKIAGKDLNVPGEPDISASFGSTFDWYLGIDGNPGNKYDFVSVVLHEIGHGLGFFAIDNYNTTDNTATRNPGAYDAYIEDGNGLNIFDVPDGTAELGAFLTNTNLFLNAPLSTISNGGTPPKIYAPNPYNAGSSISHWDDATFDGTENALMTHAASPGESIHNPGPNMMSLFANMGWVHTYMKHQPDLFIDNLTDDILITLQVVSDTTLAVEAPLLHYSYDNFATQTNQLLTDDGNGNYSFSIPNPGIEATLEYYITGVTDVLNRTYTSPSIVTDQYKTVIRNLNSISVPYTMADGGDFEAVSDFTQIGLKGNVAIWEQGVPTNTLNTPSSGTQVWKTDLDANILKPNADYSTVLISPKFDLSDTTADYNIKFDLSMDVPSDSAIAGLSAVYSIDGGKNWLDLGYPNDGKGENWMNVSEQYSLFENGNAWIENNVDVAPQTVSHSLSDLIGDGENEVYFGLVASVTNNFIDAVYVFDGIMIDNFEITKTSPRAFFSVANADVLFPNEDVQFTYTSRGAESFTWNFGDGQISHAKNPVHSYQNGGSYDVELMITYPGGTHTYMITNAVSVITSKGPNYALADGGDMESNPSDFLVQNVKGTSFERGESSIAGKNGTASGANAWVTGLNDAQYVNSSLAYVYTPSFNFSLLGNYELSFKANYSFEDGWDGFILEYSLNNGASWQQVNPTVESGWYDKIGEDNAAQGWPAIPLFTGTTNGNFVTKTVDVSDFSENSQVAFRFKFLTDAAAVDVGMALDDFILTGPTEGAAVPDFTFAGATGCEGQVVTYTNTSSGSITSMTWNFGANATPATGEGSGPFEVTYSGTGTSTVVLSVDSPVNGAQIEQKDNIISTAPIPTVAITQEAIPENDAQLKLVSTAADSYQWFEDFNLIDGETNQSYIATKSATYSVEVEIDGCKASSDNTNIITSLVDDSLKKSFAVFPNPASSTMNIDIAMGTNKPVKILIYNESGNLFYTSFDSINGGLIEKKINVANFSRGLYFVEIQSGEKRAVQKIIIQ